MPDIWLPYKIEEDFKISSFYSAFIRDCNGEYFFQGESHDFWELCFVVKGSVCLSVDDKVIRLCEDQIIFHKPMEFHSLRTDNNTTTALLIVSFSAEGDFINFFKDKTFTLSHNQKKNVLRIINYLKETCQPQDKEYIPWAYLDILKEKQNGMKLLKNITENLLISLADTHASKPDIIKNSETDIYTDSLRIISNNIYTKLTVNELAKLCNVSSAYLKKIFAKYNGLGIHEYILQTKISIAKQMLADGEQISEIADALAFSTQNYFSTAFKRETGYTPKEYANL